VPLQNRVDPFGEIHAVEWRGMFTGNRGVIHDPDTKTLLRRRWSTKAWIICTCEYKGKRRQVMGRNAPSGNAGWTELFFLDEVTALAAGHRPCFECRREQAKEFVRRYGEAFGVANPKVGEIDGRLHGERLASGGTLKTITADDIAALPDGAMVAVDGSAHAVASGALSPWHFSGYGPSSAHGATAGAVTKLITSPTTLAALKAGYRPVWHPTIKAKARRPLA
jgi:hypothetical protein